MFDSIECEYPDGFLVDLDYVTCRVTISGELDFATAHLMVDATAVLQQTAGDITINLEAVTFMDAGAFGALVRLRGRQQHHHSTLKIIGTARVARMADLCGLLTLITDGVVTTCSACA